MNSEKTVRITEPRSPGRLPFWFTIFFDALLCIITSVYAYFAYNQWRVMRNQAELMTQQLEVTKRSIEQTQEMLGYANQQAKASSAHLSITQKSERPFIAIGSLSLTNVRANEHPSYTVIYQNSGRTTALKVSVVVIVQLSYSPLAEKPIYPEVSGPTSVFDLGVGAQRQISNTAKFILKPADIEAIKQEKAWLYVYGFGQYSDGTDQPYRMKFCVYYSPVDRVPPSVTSTTVLTRPRTSNPDITQISDGERI